VRQTLIDKIRFLGAVPNAAASASATAIEMQSLPRAAPKAL
jgi:hypothetical protein